MSGEIGVRAYVTEAGEDKRFAHLCTLCRAVLKDQPALRLKMLHRAAHYRAQRLEGVPARCQREARLVPQHAQRRVVTGDVGWIAHDQVKALAAYRGVPVALAKLHLRQS